MENTLAERIIHAYDTQLRRIVCGIAGHTNSTKHTAGVTCPDCRAILDGRPVAPAARDPRGAP